MFSLSNIVVKELESTATDFARVSHILDLDVDATKLGDPDSIAGAIEVAPSVNCSIHHTHDRPLHVTHFDCLSIDFVSIANTRPVVCTLSHVYSALFNFSIAPVRLQKCTQHARAKEARELLRRVRTP